MRQTDGHVEGCHATEESATAQMQALYAQEASKVEKNPQHIAGLLRHLADLIGSYGMPLMQPWATSTPYYGVPRSHSTLAPLDMATLWPAVKVCKVDDDEQLVFGWASVSAADGRLVIDSDGELIEPAELERAAYDYVLEAREAGELHKGDAIGRVVESFVVTPEKISAMGLNIPPMTGWWFGVRVDDPGVYAKVKSGEYQMFSIQGSAEREEVEA